MSLNLSEVKVTHIYLLLHLIYVAVATIYSSCIYCFSQIESMSLFVGMDKHTFLEKYTEEKESDGVYFTKLKHKKDLSCIMLDIGKPGFREFAGIISAGF